MAKLNREAMATYLDTTFNTKVSEVAKATFEIIGDDIEEMSVELNPDVEQNKNILGQTKTKDNGYEPSMDADPFYADPDKELYKKVRDIALGRLKGDSCKTLMLEVIVEDTAATTYTAYVREVLVKPQSYGGDTGGLNFPFNVMEDGASVKGTVTAASVTSGSPVFTAASE
uniref:Uncharacterized protein n=1 Tax=Siphoviridae sp. ctOyJ30 TaxID=2826317 RepID=A0A8S5NCQ7_9CAUD|nr:MAG TPA: hypothetical protein [Siphoviridae sp. ctOyJ30]